VVEILQRADLKGAKASITASEIHSGVLERLHVPAFRFFYFREQSATDSVPEPFAREYREREGGVASYELDALKERISKASTKVLVSPGRISEEKIPVRSYSCSWDARAQRFVGLKDFGDQVCTDLLSSVDAQFGTETPSRLDEFEVENAAMEAFVETRVERYVVGSRGEFLSSLRRHAEGDGGSGVLCLVGSPGSGKSALLAKFCRDLVEGNNGEGREDEPLLISHFVGATAASTNVQHVLRRLSRELVVGASLDLEVPEEYGDLLVAFPRFLTLAAAARRVIIVLDAVDQLETARQATTLNWLPESLPDNARLILSAAEIQDRQTPALEAARARRTKPEELRLRARTPPTNLSIC
jgi:hypothetical protein